MSINNVKYFDLPKICDVINEIIISWSVVINRNIYISENFSSKQLHFYYFLREIHSFMGRYNS